ncbi:macrophage mannose receptor 1-like [Dendrobates tinctorius]|uniref:macrophage mannose receptor 1-like n=1 Tax=Dendrobates tinctorius TaxID=92724 RepID=UPI003CCA3C0E
MNEQKKNPQVPTRDEKDTDDIASALANQKLRQQRWKDFSDCERIKNVENEVDKSGEGGGGISEMDMVYKAVEANIQDTAPNKNSLGEQQETGANGKYIQPMMIYDDLCDKPYEGDKTFLIYNNFYHQCLQAENSVLVVAKCNENSNTQKFQWISKEQLINVGTSQCLSASSIAEWSAVTLQTCDGDNYLQKWECKNKTFFGVLKKDRYVTYRDEKKLVLSLATGDWSRWKIYSTDDDLCDKPYEEKYTLKGNANGQPCKFPFKYNNKVYVDCTTDGKSEGRPWCATTPDYDTDQLFGYCPSKSLSDDGWKTDSITGANYQINSDSALTWYQARRSCQQQDAELLSITELHEQSYISGSINGLTTALWIGLNSLEVTSGWRWEGGHPFRYLNWLPGNPSEEPDTNCAALNPGKYTKWESKACEKKLGYICKKGSSKPTETPSTGSSDAVSCPSSWTPYNGHCYYLYSDAKIWKDAVSSCRKEESDLVSVHNIEEASAITSQFQFGNAEYVWLGLNDLKTQLFFEWSDGSPVTFTTWQSGEPSHLNDEKEDCVVLSTKDGKWADKVCDHKNPYICKRKPLPKDKGQVTDDHPGCNEGWKRHGYYCYLIGESPGSFTEANSTCNNHGAFLLTVDDRFEQVYLTSLIGFRLEKYFWTGLSDTEDRNTFKWANGQNVLYTHWNADMPGERQGCVAMRTGNKAGLWDVINCEEKVKYVCKKLAQGVTPPPIPKTTAEPTCPANWTTTDHGCIKYYSGEVYGMKTWTEARDFCRTIGGDLLSITSKEEKVKVTSMLNGGIFNCFYIGVWIGLMHSNLDEGFTWSDGSPLNYENWEYSKPDNSDEQDKCVAMNSFWFSWHNVHCDLQFQWICKLQKGKELKEEPKPLKYNFTSDGWLIYNDHQYYVSKNEMPMEKAQEFCKSNFSHLVTINSDSEWKFILKYTSKDNGLGSYYIGLRLGLDKVFKWVDGSPIDFVAWGRHQPDFANDDEFCAVMDKPPGFWNDINCGYSHKFICERSNSSINTTFAPTVPTPDGGCPKDWLSFGKKCYRILGTEEGKAVDWNNARLDCQSMGANLVSINDDLEQSFLISNLRDVRGDLWIGFHNKNDLRFVWTDQSGVYYTNWAKGHPHRWYRNQCAVLQLGSRVFAGSWVNVECDLNKGYICQKFDDPSLPVSPNTPPDYSNYIKYGEASYKFAKAKRNWDEAQEMCVKEGSKLVSITDEFTSSFLKLHLRNHKQPFWIGLHSGNETQNTYKWVDNWKVRYTKWAAAEPSNDNGCVYVDTDGQWKTSSCDDSYYSFICKQTSVPAPTDPPQNPGTCPDTQGWIPFRNHCYHFESSNTDGWSEASHRCLFKGANLVSIEDQIESNFLLHHTELLNDQVRGFWIGLFRNVEDKWLWTDNAPLDFVNWDQGIELKALHSTCITMSATKGTWEESWCYSNRGYICKRLKTPPPTEKPSEIPEVQSSRGEVIGIVLPMILVLAAIGTAVFFLCRRKGIKPQPENGFTNRIYFDSSGSAATQDANVLVENIGQNEHANP